MKLHLLGASIALALGSAGAIAAPSTASFQIDSFSYVASGGTLNWLADGGYQALRVESKEAGGLGGSDLDDVDGVRGNASLSTQVAHATARASATADGLLAGQVSALPFAIDLTAQPHSGSATAQQLGEFTLSQAGSVTFTVGYTLSAAAPAGNTLYAYSLASLVFDAGNYDTNVNRTFTDELMSTDAGNGTRSGTFSYTVSLAGPDQVGYYNFTGNAYGSAVAAVPEPGEWALMLAGLGLLGGWRLRQQRREAATEVSA